MSHWERTREALVKGSDLGVVAIRVDELRSVALKERGDELHWRI